MLGHVEPEAMLFCFEAMSRGTIADGARLIVERIPGAGWCAACEKTVALEDRFGACPHCGQLRVRMTSGDELRVREMEVE
jgi:hydrogenase nickel incorporation protein HypA/HybF